jgi:hypothetical protein
MMPTCLTGENGREYIVTVLCTASGKDLPCVRDASSFFALDVEDADHKHTAVVLQVGM